MKSVARTTRLMILVFSVLITYGCAKKIPPSEENIASPPPAPSMTTEEMKKIVVAKVNDVDITLDSLARMENIVRANRPAGSPPETDAEVRKKALDQVVLRELALQMAARQGLKANDKDVDDAMEYFIKTQGHDTGFQAFLREQNLTENEVRAQIEKSVLLQTLFNKEVTGKISVSDEDMKKEYELQKDRLKTPEKTAVVDVLIPAGPDEQASLKKAEELLADIKADKDKNPMNLARDAAFSVSERTLDKAKEPALYEASRKLKTGGLSSIIKEDDGLHIVKLIEYAPERQLSLEEVKEPLEKRVKALAQRKRIGEWEAELKKDAKIEIVLEKP